MLSAQEIVLEYVCPAAGAIAANIMFSAPYRDVVKATEKTGRLDSLNPTPWAFMLGNTFGWIAYSMLIRNFFVFFANSPGFLLSVYFNMAAVKLQYENQKISTVRQSIVGALHKESSRRLSMIVDEPSSTTFPCREEDSQRGNKHDTDGGAGDADGGADTNGDAEEGAFGFARIVWEVTSQHQPVPAPHERLVLGIATYWMIIISIIAFGDKSLSQSTREMIVGVAVNANLVFFYGAPLSTIYDVLKTRSSISIHIPTMITNTANGIFWCAYGAAVFDMFIAVPNGLGALLGFIQVFLCFTFPRKELVPDHATISNNNTLKETERKSLAPLVEEPRTSDKTELKAEALETTQGEVEQENTCASRTEMAPDPDSLHQ